jgi:hypothetical protein
LTTKAYKDTIKNNHNNSFVISVSKKHHIQNNIIIAITALYFTASNASTSINQQISITFSFHAEEKIFLNPYQP